MANTAQAALLPLSAYKIDSLPPTAYYIPSFLSSAESDILLRRISEQPWTELSHRRLQPHPAPLTPSGHLLTAKSLLQFLQVPIIPRILSLHNLARVEEDSEEISKRDTAGIFTNSPHGRPNHVLINEYPPGTGISAHEDGGAYFPVVCTISLGSHIVLEVEPKKTEDENATETKKYRIYQEPLSLLITTDEMYTKHLHGISPVQVDMDLTGDTIANWSLLSDDTRDMITKNEGQMERTDVRISLTYRDVLKVKDAGRLFGGRKF